MIKKIVLKPVFFCIPFYSSHNGFESGSALFCRIFVRTDAILSVIQHKTGVNVKAMKINLIFNIFFVNHMIYIAYPSGMRNSR